MAEGFIPDTEPGVQGFGICVRDAREVLVNPTFTVTVDAPFDVLSTEPASAVVERPTPTTARISIPKLSVGGTESMAVRLRLVAPDATGDRSLSITGAADLIYDGIPAGTLPLDFEEVTLHFAPAASAPGPAAPAPRAAAKADPTCKQWRTPHTRRSSPAIPWRHALMSQTWGRDLPAMRPPPSRSQPGPPSIP